jgi:hypothetical protein
MKRLYLVTPIIFLLFIGCSSTYKITDNYSEEELFKDFNNAAQKKEMEIALTSDSSFCIQKGANIYNNNLILNSKQNKIKYIPIMKLEKASYINHLLGMLYGTIIGAITGGLAGTIRWGEINTATTIGGITGALFGAVIGYIFGYKYNYEFHP